MRLDDLRFLLDLLNETLASAIVVLAASLSLYNLTRNIKNRVARTSGFVLFCVTVVYMVDVLLSLGPGLLTFEALVRVQWIGLSLIPAAMFHLSDALLATTGMPSRGRRRRIVRLLYGIAIVFIWAATLTDSVIVTEIRLNQVNLRAAPGFLLYLIYYVVVNAVALFNVQRARRRCLTRSTERRMAYLQFAMITPLIGVFPFSAFLDPGGEYSTNALILVNIANFGVILMLVFLSFPLSFFGSRVPDRVVKADLLRFMLLGPGTGLIALVVVIYTIPATQLVGIPGVDFTPVAVVTMILMWQWVVDILVPLLERRLIYHNEDDIEHRETLENLNKRLSTRGDQLQLLEAILEATCDYLRVDNAFITAINGHDPVILRKVGEPAIMASDFMSDKESLFQEFEVNHNTLVRPWRSFWLIFLYSTRSQDTSGNLNLLGFMGIEARSEIIDLTLDDEQTLRTFVRRAAQTLDNMQLQREIFAALEGLLPQLMITTNRAPEVQYRQGHTPDQISELNRDEVIEQVHAALRHYWGGPGLASSRLLGLNIVQNYLAENDNNAVRALREVLFQAIENQRPDPEAEPDFRSPEWTIYNILKLRFVDQKKVRDATRRLYMSDANFYRKQNVAIEAVADALISMEAEAEVVSAIPEGTTTL